MCIANLRSVATSGLVAMSGSEASTGVVDPPVATYQIRDELSDRGPKDYTLRTSRQSNDIYAEGMQGVEQGLHGGDICRGINFGCRLSHVVRVKRCGLEKWVGYIYAQ